MFLFLSHYSRVFYFTCMLLCQFFWLLTPFLNSCLVVQLSKWQHLCQLYQCRSCWSVNPYAVNTEIYPSLSDHIKHFLPAICSSSTLTAQWFPSALQMLLWGPSSLYTSDSSTLLCSAPQPISDFPTRRCPSDLGKMCLEETFQLTHIHFVLACLSPVRNSWSEWREHLQLPNASAFFSISHYSCWSIPFNNTQEDGNCHFSGCCFWVGPWMEQLHAQGTTLLSPVFIHLIPFKLQAHFSCHLLICQALKLRAPGLVLQTPV